MSIRFIILITSYLLVAASQLFSQKSEMFFDRISTLQGLPSNIIRCIYQDKTGFIWIGTPQGLCQYDGKKFEIYSASEGNSSLTDNYIIDIFEDRNDKLWILTREGLNLFNRKTMSFTCYPNLKKTKNHLIITLRGNIAEDNNDNLWFGEIEGGLFRFNKEEKTFTSYSMFGNSVSFVYFDPKGELWVGTVDGYISRYNREKDSFTNYKNPYLECPHFPKTYVADINRVNDSLLQVANSTGIFLFNILNEKYSPLEVTSSRCQAIKENEIKVLFYDHDSSIWLGTGNRGIFHLPTKNAISENYLSHPNNSLSLSNNDINAILRDKEGNLWIGTQDGLNFSDSYKVLFSHYQHNPEDPNSLNINFITSFYEDRKGNIWIGTFGGGVNIYNRKKNSYRHYVSGPKDSGTLINNSVRAICEDRNGSIWIGTTNGLSKFNPIKKQFENYHGEDADPKYDIMCITPGFEDDIWVGTFGAGINRIDINTGKIIASYSLTSEPRLNSNYIRSIFRGEKDTIYLGTLGGGLNILNSASNVVEIFIHNEGDEFSLSDDNINCITRDPRGNLWLATWKGLAIFDIKDKRFLNLTTRDGLPDNNISEVISDPEGNLWVSSYNGISRLVLHEGKVAYMNHFTVENGLQGNKFNVNASLKTQDNHLFFGGANGFNVLDLAQVHRELYNPPLLITRILFDNRVIYNSAENTSLSGENKISMSHKDEVLKIEFSSLSYSKRNTNYFKYILEGYDNQWHTLSRDTRNLSFANLPPGNYRFRILNSSVNGEWNESGKIIELVVNPSFWLTGTAIFLYIIFGLSLLLAVRYITILNHQKKHALEIEMLQMKKAEEINQLKMKFFTDLSHEIKTPLTLISGPVKNLLRTNGFNKLVTEQLQMISNNSERLLKLATQLINFRKAESGNLGLKVLNGDIIHFVKDIKKAFENHARLSNISFVFNADTDSFTTYYDPEKLEIILINLLSNAFKFTPPKGKIELSVLVVQEKTDLSRWIKISVKDNGAGIAQDQQDKIFKRFYRIDTNPVNHSIFQDFGSGIGLSLSKELTELHHGTLEVFSEPGKGAEFIISIPDDPTVYVQEEIFETDLPATPHPILSSSPLINSKLNYTASENEADATAKTATILIAEDNHEILHLMRIILENEFKILGAENGENAFHLATKYIPDLVITDVLMPVKDGKELCEMLKNDHRTCHIPIILITSYNSDESEIDSYNAGADDYISKPFDPKVLISRIKNLLLSREKLKNIFSGAISDKINIPLNKLDKEFIEKVINIIEANLAELNFSQENLAQEMGMSRSSLYRKIKSLMNQSASELIRDVKIKKASKLLKDGYNVNEVLFMVGIGSRSYFNKCFRTAYGESPKNYTKSPVR